jgi:phosphoglycolate phosphatase-like HAD superfamily hydrolase
MSGVKNVILSDAPISKIIRRVKRFDLERQLSLIAGRPDAKVDEERKKGEEHLKYYEDTRREVGAYDTDVRIEVLSDQKKPNVNLTTLLRKSPEEVAEQVVVVGDNFSKDIHTAYRNDCFGFFARYGAADRDSVSSLYEFAPPGVVTRNAAGIDLSKENMGIIQEMRNKLRIVDSPMEVLRAVQDHNEKLAA